MTVVAILAVWIVVAVIAGLIIAPNLYRHEDEPLGRIGLGRDLLPVQHRAPLEKEVFV